MHTWIFVQVLFKCTNIFFAYIKWKNITIKGFNILPLYSALVYRLQREMPYGVITWQDAYVLQDFTTDNCLLHRPDWQQRSNIFPLWKVTGTFSNVVSCHLLLHAVMALIYGKYLSGCCKIANRHDGSSEITRKLQSLFNTLDAPQTI